MRKSWINRFNGKSASMFAALAVLLCGAMFAGAGAAADSVKTCNGPAVASIEHVPATGTLTFIFFSDMHIPFDDKGVVSKITKRANELKPAFVITGGDNVQVGNPANFSNLMPALKRFKVPIICAIGNHDTSFSDYADQNEWKKRFGPTYFYFDAGPARIIVLNNANFELGDEQFGFLENALKTDLRKIVVMHRPPDYLNPLYDTPMRDSKRFRELVESAGVTAVLMGHEHHFGDYKVGGVRYIVSGGAGGKLDDKCENEFHNFIIVKISPDKFEVTMEKL